ncbi:GIY-YIG nuclease family protein [Mucilaginibacter corticis]|uniref:GIY-YIG nuclease family protein n=1 Tax=Mucilaginibacter corticis TaxID=2597670 RepID=A0A556MX50_9SPHI|nr:GIY-YIG nuclease family protein [Mucilaginibacter corticis]TSJ44388.1 GIY-YIG nuclease family protein [Mucilaginibacter corticis]
MLFYTYIIYSASTKKFYVGQTDNLILRLEQHNLYTFIKSSTKYGIPWDVYLVIECCNRKQAVNIESHLKKMKSTKYYQSLKMYPEIAEKLKEKYPG